MSMWVVHVVHVFCLRQLTCSIECAVWDERSWCLKCVCGWVRAV